MSDIIMRANQSQILHHLYVNGLVNKSSIFVRGDAKQAVYALAKRGLVGYVAFSDTDNRSSRSFECLQVWDLR